MKINKVRLFPYFGSKVQLSKKYPAPIKSTIIEPFAGAAGYSCLYYRKKVILYEKAPIVYEVIKFLIEATQDDIMSLPVYTDIDQTVDDFNIPQVAKNLIGYWSNTGTFSPAKRLSTWGKYHVDNNKNQKGIWSENVKERLKTTVSLIKHWEVYNEDYTEAFKKYGNDKDITWFIDPPYQNLKGKFYYLTNEQIDFKQLGKVCKKLKGQVIVCEYKNADWLPFTFFSNNYGNMNTNCKELIWTNQKTQKQKLLIRER